MATDKKSFIAYCDWGEIFDELTNEEAGKLVKHLFDYVRDENPKEEDKLTKMMFIQIKQSLKRDLVKYQKYTSKQSENGKKGGRPKKAKESEETQPFLDKPKKADSVSVNVNDSVNVTVNDNDILLPKEPKKFSFKNSLINYGFKKELVEDWMLVRKNKKATNTETSFKTFILEVEKTKEDRDSILRLCVEKDWKGFKSSWDWKEKSSPKQQNNLQPKKDYSKWQQKKQ